MLWRSSATSGVIGSDEGWEHDDEDGDVDDGDDVEVGDDCVVDTLDGEDAAADVAIVVVDDVVVAAVVCAEVEVDVVEDGGSGSLYKCKCCEMLPK